MQVRAASIMPTDWTDRGYSGTSLAPVPNSTDSGHRLPRSGLTSPSHVEECPDAVPVLLQAVIGCYDADGVHQSGSTPEHLIDFSRSVPVLTHSSSGNSLEHPDNHRITESPIAKGTRGTDCSDSHDMIDSEREAGSMDEHKRVTCAIPGYAWNVSC